MTMLHEDIFVANLLKANELLERVRWACIGLLEACWEEGKYFRILEAYRSQSRQLWLWGSGRWRPGPIVTRTRQSLHTARLAIDVKPLEGVTYEQIADVAARFEITWPLGKGVKGFVDKPHLEFNLVRSEPVPPVIIMNPEAKIRALERAVERADNPTLRNTLQQQIGRLRARI